MNNTPEWLKEEICKIISDKKGKDILTISVSHLTIVADYFVLCSGRSTTQVKGIAGAIDDEMSKLGVEPLRREGITEGRWAALDYGSIIVHIFNEEAREVYCLDKLWDDGTNVVRYEGQPDNQ